MSKKRIFVEAGHGGPDPGAVKYVTESKETIKMVNLTADELRNNYDCVVYADVSADSTHEISARANNWKADLFVSFHENAGGGDGWECYLYDKSNRHLGNTFWKYVQTTGQNAHGDPVKYDPTLNVLRLTDMPAILVETVFVDNNKDIRDWDETKELKVMAKAYAKAIAEYLKLPKKSKTEPKAYPGQWPKLPTKGYFERGSFGTQVKYLQMFLKWALNDKSIEVDGIVGVETIKAVKRFQKLCKLEQDGLFGKESLNAAKKLKR